MPQELKDGLAALAEEKHKKAMVINGVLERLLGQNEESQISELDKEVIIIIFYLFWRFSLFNLETLFIHPIHYY